MPDLDGCPQTLPFGVSTEVLLFSDINLSLTHHYRVFKRGLPHLAFRRDYLACLRVFVSQATALAQCDMASPVPPSSVSARHARSSEVESESPRKTRRARRRMRPARVRDEPVGVEFPTLTVQDIPDLAGAIIYDCCPPLLPVSLWLKDIGLLPRSRPVASASLAAPPPEDPMVIGGASQEGVAVQELGVAPPDASGTDLEDELPTPEDSMVIGGASPERDLKDELLNMSPLPTIVSPLTEPVEALLVSPSLYPEPPVPAQPDPVPSVELRDVPLREADERPMIDLFPSFLISPAQSYYDPATSPITSDLQDDSGYLQPDSPATMDQYIVANEDLLLGDPSELQLLSLPLLPVPVQIRCQSGLPPLGSQFWCPRWCCRTCLRRAPLMWIGLLRGRGTLHGC